MNGVVRSGIDEVGRGALAGPLVACGVVLKVNPKKLVRQAPVEIRDSKKMTKLQRERLVEWLGISDVLNTPTSTKLRGPLKRAYAPANGALLSLSLALVPVLEINRWGMGWANRRVFELVIEGMVQGQSPEPTEYVVDGKGKVEVTRISTSLDQEIKATIKAIPKADTKVLEVMLAANIAKVYRDKLMNQLHEEFPHFGWDKNAGYGTRTHLSALDEHGACAHHRLKFVENALLKFRRAVLFRSHSEGGNPSPAA